MLVLISLFVFVLARLSVVDGIPNDDERREGVELCRNAINYHLSGDVERARKLYIEVQP